MHFCQAFLDDSQFCSREVSREREKRKVVAWGGELEWSGGARKEVKT